MTSSEYRIESLDNNIKYSKKKIKYDILYMFLVIINIILYSIHTVTSFLESDKWYLAYIFIVIIWIGVLFVAIKAIKNKKSDIKKYKELIDDELKTSNYSKYIKNQRKKKLKKLF